MRIEIITLFPEICRAPLNESIMKRAQEKEIIDVHIHNLRDWTSDKHHVVDDAPFGGGQGMVMKPEPIFAAVEDLKRKTSNAQHPTPNGQKSKVILMSPAGRRFNQRLATELSQQSHLIIVCGHYEGVDHRVIEHLVDLEISIGDYVLTNGAIVAVVLVDAIVRLLPGALGHEQSAADDSFSAESSGLEAPQYTRPAEFRGWKVPEVLLSGNHAEIAKWRKEQAIKRTRENRPDLLR
jgi:tRNA (guanine37-N1)-methyltransferase